MPVLGDIRSYKISPAFPAYRQVHLVEMTKEIESKGSFRILIPNFHHRLYHPICRVKPSCKIIFYFIELYPVGNKEIGINQLFAKALLHVLKILPGGIAAAH